MWDALAVAKTRDGRGVLLVEAKAHPSELTSTRTAKDLASIEQIDAALTQTRVLLGVTGAPSAWTAGLYQSANRLAHVVWLRSRGLRAFLAHVLFCDDRSYRPTPAAVWLEAIAEADRRLGLENTRLPYVRHVLVDTVPGSADPASTNLEIRVTITMAPMPPVRGCAASGGREPGCVLQRCSVTSPRASWKGVLRRISDTDVVVRFVRRRLAPPAATGDTSRQLATTEAVVSM